MCKVNGWFPNYGCSRYQVEDGDVICWVLENEGDGALVLITKGPIFLVSKRSWQPDKSEEQLFGVVQVYH